MSCFGGRASKLQAELIAVKQTIEDRDNEVANLKQQEALTKQKQSEAAAAHVVQLEQWLLNEKAEKAEQHRLEEQRRQQLERRLEAEQKLRAEQQRQGELQLRQLHERFQEEQKQRTEQQKLTEHVQFRLAAEEQRSRRLQKQIASFTETMEEVSKVITAVESDQKHSGQSPRVVQHTSRKPRPSMADQLRQSLARYKQAKEQDKLQVVDDQNRLT